MCLTYPGIKILILRKTYAELINNHINEMRPMLYGVAKYNSSEKKFLFPNGSNIKFGYCANDGDLDQYQGVECDAVFFDEASQFQELWIRKITASVRGANKFPKRMYYTLNPGGPSHGYFKRLFIDKTYNEGEDPGEYEFIQSKVTDNSALMEMQPDYIKQLEALPFKLRKAWLEGDWTILEGAFFEEWTDDPEHYQDRRNTHVIDPFEPPRDWPVYRSFDWGYARPFSCGYWTVDYEGTVYRILEMYGRGREDNEGCRWTPDKVFSELATLEREHPWLKGKRITGVADPSIWSKDTGVSIEETASAHGIYFSKGDNQRLQGWMQCHYRMQFNEDGYPRMYVFTNCKEFRRTIPLMMYDLVKPEDLDSDLEDHQADECRYFLMSRPIKPIVKVEKEPVLFDPLDQYKVKPYRRV